MGLAVSQIQRNEDYRFVRDGSCNSILLFRFQLFLALIQLHASGDEVAVKVLEFVKPLNRSTVRGIRKDCGQGCEI